MSEGAGEPATGDKYELEFDLGQAFDLGAPGAYDFLGTYQISFFNPLGPADGGSGRRPARDMTPIWYDYVAAPFVITIEP